MSGPLSNCLLEGLKCISCLAVFVRVVHIQGRDTAVKCRARLGHLLGQLFQLQVNCTQLDSEECARVGVGGCCRCACGERFREVANLRLNVRHNLLHVEPKLRIHCAADLISFSRSHMKLSFHLLQVLLR